MGSHVNQQKPKVLIVEDDRDISSVVGIALEDFYDLTIARSADDAILAVRSESFELVLLDWRLGNSCGSEVLNEIESLDAGSRPHVVITSGGKDDSLQDALQTGEVFVLPKPYHLEELALTITRVLKKDQTPNSNSRHPQ